jgi:NADH dehydrogenase
MQTGRTVGRNIARVAEGRAPEPFRFRAFGDACALGRRRAVAQLRGIPLTGVLAWVVWRAFLLYYIPAWDRRVRLLLDWLIVPLTGREVVQMQVTEPVGLRHELYEAEQDVVRQGDVGSRLYLVCSGELDVVRRDEAGREETLARLGPGDHFGELAVFLGSRRTATVRARTRVKLLAVGREDAVALGATLRAFGDEVRALPGTPAAGVPTVATP